MTSKDLDPNHPKWAYKQGQPRKLVATGPGVCSSCRWDIAPGDPVKMVSGVRDLTHWDCQAHHMAVLGGHLPGRVAKTLRTREEIQMEIEIKTRFAESIRRKAEIDAQIAGRLLAQAEHAARLLAQTEDAARLLADRGDTSRIDVESDDVTGGSFEL